jgi:hypothetical protein
MEGHRKGTGVQADAASMPRSCRIDGDGAMRIAGSAASCRTTFASLSKAVLVVLL